MAKKKPAAPVAPAPSPFAHIRDPAIRRQMEELAAKDAQGLVNEETIAAAPVLFIFSSPDIPAVGKAAEVVNHFGQRSGGTVVEKLSDDVYRVRVYDDLTVLVHANYRGWYGKQ